MRGPTCPIQVLRGGQDGKEAVRLELTDPELRYTVFALLSPFSGTPLMYSLSVRFSRSLRQLLLGANLLHESAVLELSLCHKSDDRGDRHAAEARLPDDHEEDRDAHEHEDDP